jgi:HEAT repeat protein
MGAKAVPLLVDAVHDPDPTIRIRGLQGLELIGPDALEAVPALTEALKDEDTKARIAAERALGAVTRGSDAGVPALVAVLSNEAEAAEVRAEAATALGRIGPTAQAASPVLIRALKDRQPLVREKAAEALAGAGRGSREELVALAESLDDPEAWDEAAEALQRMRIEDVTPLIQQLSSKEARARLTAAKALRLVRPRGREAREAIPALTEALQDEDEQVRNHAAAALYVIKAGTGDGSDPPAGINPKLGPRRPKQQ